MRTECPRNLTEFWNYRDILNILDGLVLKGIRIIVPNQCREELLEKLHEGHFSVDRTKLRARESVFCPGINKDIETLLKLVVHAKKMSK